MPLIPGFAFIFAVCFGYVGAQYHFGFTVISTFLFLAIVGVLRGATGDGETIRALRWWSCAGIILTWLTFWIVRIFT